MSSSLPPTPTIAVPSPFIIPAPGNLPPPRIYLARTPADGVARHRRSASPQRALPRTRRPATICRGWAADALRSPFAGSVDNLRPSSDPCVGRVERTRSSSASNARGPTTCEGCPRHGPPIRGSYCTADLCVRTALVTTMLRECTIAMFKVQSGATQNAYTRSSFR
ncbi:uncharacterized protein B0H18DRAFT_620179 [Fomitopsis serialis]|uniref:uncharacterized protein n=1 Tax=Fomitopsis serialis TaxID=139415 RepID=UPI002008757E|nr:uncharacterized protein B0H18DRAFT_620179 [Neoantrodia serialis]KAH9919924.1 hypothetical protein B0H18DRAFT_620179 [Neoantrodia serialis]